VTGRSYIVNAPTRDIAPYMARIQAAAEGQRNVKGSRILYIERLARGQYEVVIEAR
jgi:hypothetical protein